MVEKSVGIKPAATYVFEEGGTSPIITRFTSQATSIMILRGW
jgi:hypothetical protein